MLLHGFTQTKDSWPDEIVRTLRATHDVHAVDCPGHGRAAAIRADLRVAAQTFSTMGPASFVGYSMGGRIALHIAVHHPAAVDRLVLIGATAGIERDDERAARRVADEELASSIERDGVEAFLERWLANPLFATLPSSAARLGDRLQNTAAGLASSLRLTGTGTQEPLWDALGAVRAPVLFVTGGLDEKFTALAERMASRWGGPAEVAVVPGAGHAVHLERPAEVGMLVGRFLHEATSEADSTSP